jgi:hypothetical protein
MQSDWLVSAAGCMPYSCSQRTHTGVCTNETNFIGDRIMINMERIDCVSEVGPMQTSAARAAKTLGINPRSLWTRLSLVQYRMFYWGIELCTHITACMNQRAKLPSS